MDRQPIEAIIFDLGNVLISVDYSVVAEKVAAVSSKPLAEIYQLFFDSGLSGLFEEASLSPEEFFIKAKELLGFKMSYTQFVSVWNSIFFISPENRRVYEIASSLKGRYKLALLTNINILHFEYIKQHFALFDVFGQVIPSFELRLRKPDPRIYHKTMEMLKVDCAERVFYTDDRQELIAKAQELGIRAFVFKGTAQLINDMAKVGIDINPGVLDVKE